MLQETLKNTRHGSPLGNERGGFCIVTVEHPSPGSVIMPKIIYKRNDIIGECIYLKDVEPYIPPSGKPMRKALFQCQKCEDKNEFIATINHVKSLRKKSCGCLINGEWNKTHGLSKHPLFDSWSTMKARCYNKNKESYHRYGGRGIVVCDEWLHDFKAYYDYVMNLPNAMAYGLTLDREDNDKDYEPNNMRWVTHHIQTANRGINKNNTSGYIGIGKQNGGWQARISVNNNAVRLGLFKTIDDAINARNKYIIDNNLTEYKLQ